MTFELELVLKSTERAFERVIGLAGRRGFAIVGVSATRSDDGETLSVRLTLEPGDGSLRAETLVRQIEKLVEVKSIGVGG